MSESNKVPGFDPTGQLVSDFKNTPLEALRNLFVGFLQGLFYSADPESRYHWDPDPNVSNIIIQDEAPTQEEVMSKRPVIVLTRGPIQLASFGMDDLQAYNQETGRKTKSVSVPGTMSVNCCSRVSLETENLAWVVAEHIWLLRDLLISNGLFDTGRQIQVGAPSPAGSIIPDDDGNKFIATVVSVPFQFIRTSAFTPLAKTIVQNIEARFNTGSSRIRTTGSPAQGPSQLSAMNCPPPALALAPDARGRTATFTQSPTYLPKQRHPLDPMREVDVQIVRGRRPGQFSSHIGPGGVVPIQSPCMEESKK